MNLDELIARNEVSLAVDRENALLRLKAVATFDESVELTADAARELAARLTELADELD